jgi:hypothetical protein
MGNGWRGGEDLGAGEQGGLKGKGVWERGCRGELRRARFQSRHLAIAQPKSLIEIYPYGR